VFSFGIIEIVYPPPEFLGACKNTPKKGYVLAVYKHRSQSKLTSKLDYLLVLLSWTKFCEQ